MLVRYRDTKLVGGILAVLTAIAIAIILFGYARRRRGVQKLELLADQFNAGSYISVLDKIRDCEKDPDLRGFVPELLYMRWASEFQAGRRNEADATAQTLIEHFPHATLAADICFERWSDHFLRGEFGQAKQDLATLNSMFPSSPVTIRANEMTRKRFDASAVTQMRGG